MSEGHTPARRERFERVPEIPTHASSAQLIGPFSVGMNERNWAAFKLGRNSHLWQYQWELNIETSSLGSSLRRGLQDALVRLAGKINPGVLIEFHHLLDNTLQRTPTNNEPARQEESGTDIESGPPEGLDGTYFAWLHSLVGQSLEAEPQLALWCQLGSVVGGFQAAVLMDPLALPPGGLGPIVNTARLLVEAGNCEVSEIEALVSHWDNVGSQENVAFLENVLDLDPQPDSTATELEAIELEAMILYGMVCELDTQIQHRLLTGVSDTPQVAAIRRSMFPYHGMDEERPPAFAHGPLSGSQKELVRWILGRVDPRQLRHYADIAIWFQREHRTRYHAYFAKERLFERAESRRAEEGN